jgi:hypothetical protein
VTTIINGSSPSITFSDGSAQTSATRPFLNRIINGAMVIDQRNAGASVTPTDGQYTLDRWLANVSQASKLTVQQNAGSVTPPAGFANYLGVTSSSSYSITSTDYFVVSQKIEGFNTADLNWGSASAKTITISFWVRSSLTGTFGGALNNNDGNRWYPFSYTISAANTWEQKSITVAGDTTGTWGTTNGVGIQLRFSLGTGSTYSASAGSWITSPVSSVTGAVSVVGTNGATFYITGVQLEVGSTATSFDYRSIGTELALCQRYFWKNSGAPQYIRIGTGPANTTTDALITVFMQTPMRVAPTSVTATGSFGVWAGATVFSVSAITIDSTSTGLSTATISATSTGLTIGTTYQLIGNNSSTASLALSAEL